MTTNRTPKPEGPAQERECIRCDWKGPQSDTVHPKHWPDDKLCPECYETTEVVPATPAPSQPAARELDQLITDIENAICYPPPHPDVSAEWSKRLKPLLEAWTAAKDAEILKLQEQVFRPLGDNHHNAALCPYCNPQREAAERERDSLREANARLAADLDAALKAGKDGQQ